MAMAAVGPMAFRLAATAHDYYSPRRLDYDAPGNAASGRLGPECVWGTNKGDGQAVAIPLGMYDGYFLSYACAG